MLSTAISLAIEKGGYLEKDIDVLFSGDLLNQIISASFAARDFNFPFLGLYSACSTMSESLLLGAMLVNAGYVDRVVAATGSHFASAERQYRYPLELGCTRPPQAQWTVTGAGGCVISSEQKGVKIVNGTMGKVCDFGVTDVNNMGAAMAPAVAIIEPYAATFKHFNAKNKNGGRKRLPQFLTLSRISVKIFIALIVHNIIDK